MREIRSIARGLSLPEIESRSPSEVVRNVVDARCARTGTNVTVTGETTSFFPNCHRRSRFAFIVLCRKG